MGDVAKGWSAPSTEGDGRPEPIAPDGAHPGGPYDLRPIGEAPRRSVVLSRRSFALAAAALLVAFGAGVSVDALALHVGQHSGSTHVVIGQQVIRPSPPTSAASGKRSSSPPPAASLEWGTPVPVDPGFNLLAVSCPATGFCAVGDSGGRVLLYQNGTWSGPDRIDGTAAINSVSCTGPQFCAAVDSAGNALMYAGSGWSHPEHVDRTPFGELTSVSCASPSFCAAVDGDGNALVYNGTSWSAPQQVDPQAWTAVSRDVASVSCPTPGYCVGVDPENNAFYFSGGSWQSAASITATAGSPAVKYANTVSCATITFCAAADNPGEVVAYDGTQWSDPVAADPTNYVASISCPTPLFCAAVDGLLPQGFSGGSATGRVVLYNGISWSTPLDIDGDGILQSISCPSAQLCVAVDQAGRAIVGTARSG